MKKLMLIFVCIFMNTFTKAQDLPTVLSNLQRSLQDLNQLLNNLAPSEQQLSEINRSYKDIESSLSNFNNALTEYVTGYLANRGDVSQSAKEFSQEIEKISPLTESFLKQMSGLGNLFVENKITAENKSKFQDILNVMLSMFDNTINSIDDALKNRNIEIRRDRRTKLQNFIEKLNITQISLNVINGLITNNLTPFNDQVKKLKDSYAQALENLAFKFLVNLNSALDLGNLENEKGDLSFTFEDFIKYEDFKKNLLISSNYFSYLNKNSKEEFNKILNKINKELDNLAQTYIEVEQKQQQIKDTDVTKWLQEYNQKIQDIINILKTFK